MGSRETRLLRGRRRGETLTRRSLTELRVRRQDLGVSQAQLAESLGYSRSQLWRLESERIDPTVRQLSEIASVLGLEVSVGLHELGDPIRDRGQQALGKRFDVIPGPAWRNTAEVLLPNPGDRRSWDRLLRLTTTEPQIVGADLETRIRDIQALVRRTRERERDGHVDAVLLVLSDSATNRRLVDELRMALGPAYATSPRRNLAALREGRRLPGSGLILV
ncbi:MAG TPA: helix-turn-helix transcriptional regulator [Candidatus Limnocylindrales bacterium]|nr:helix-turn-helix transcriptional regulator [Candidatus Limnocylindrales bacterium]